MELDWATFFGVFLRKNRYLQLAVVRFLRAKKLDFQGNLVPEFLKFKKLPKTPKPSQIQTLSSRIWVAFSWLFRVQMGVFWLFRVHSTKTK